MKNLVTGLIFSTLLIFMSCKKDNPIPSDNFTVTVENVSVGKMYSSSGMFNTPVGSTSPGGIGPGGKFQFMAKAGLGEKLSFATMFVESNDIFFAPGESGIALYDGSGNPISGDVTDQIQLWDAGTEVNEEPGVGTNQVMRQSAPGAGMAENGNVRPIAQVNDGFTYASVADVIKVSISPNGQYNFMVTIENVSTSTTLNTSAGMKAVPLSPGGWVVHSSESPLFTSGSPNFNNGIEEIAEDGNTSPFDDFTSANSGLIYPLSPGVFAIHDSGNPLYNDGAADYNEGIEAIAEDGSPTQAATSLMSRSEVISSGAFNTPVGASAPAAIGPGGKYEFTFTAEKGDRLSLATMFVQSNDLFYGFNSAGIELYNGDIPNTGDKTSSIILYDAGTEVNEEPGYGASQVIRQGGADIGTDENGTVRQVSDSFSYPAKVSIIKVTISTN